MGEKLETHLARNEQMWGIWSRTFGINEQTPLAVDFQFYSVGKGRTEKLKEQLAKMGFTVSVVSNRVMVFFRDFEITATEKRCWTLESLQARTRELYEIADKLLISLDGVGAEMPSVPRG